MTAGGEYAFYDKLDAVEERLGEDFVRIHQRYLVRAGAVSHIGSSSVEIGGAHAAGEPFSEGGQRQ